MLTTARGGDAKILGARLHELVTARIDAGPIAVVRVVIGAAALLRLVDGARILGRLVAPHTIHLPSVAWVPAPARGLVTALLVVWAIAAVCFTVGLWTRTAGTLLAAVFVAVIVLDEQTYSNHLYLLSVVVALLVLADAGAVLSLDARGPARASAPATVPATVPAWPVTLLKLQVSIVYGFAALAKLNPEYLAGDTLARFIPSSPVHPILGARLMAKAFIAAAIASIVAEACVAVWLWRPRLRGLAVALGVALHVGMVAAVGSGVRLQLVIFAVEMWALYLLFFDPAALMALRAPRRAHHRPLPEARKLEP